jgi:diaminopimelate decarboxylase
MALAPTSCRWARWSGLWWRASSPETSSFPAWENNRHGLEIGILSFNVESLGEIKTIAEIAKSAGKVAPISLRINPNIDAKTHPHISTGLYTTKFGIAETLLNEAVKEVVKHPSLKLVGLDCHIGSQITELEPFRDAARRMAQLAGDLARQGVRLEVINLGGGLGIKYQNETPPGLEAYAQTLVNEIRDTGLKLVLEPGRVMIGNAGGLLTRVVGTKATSEKRFVITDAAMNDLIRPSLYSAYHEIVPVKESGAGAERALVDVVGPICETGDFLGRGRELPAGLEVGDLLFVRSAGAYGAAMASHYNTRPQAAEVLVHEGSYRVVRPRETLESLWALELDALKELK